MPTLGRIELATILAAATVAVLRSAAATTEGTPPHPRRRDDDEHLPSSRRASASTSAATKLRSSLCVDSMCSVDCVAYRTPLNACYNGATLFPGDPSWGEYDVMDRVDGQVLGGLRPTGYGDELELDAEYEPFWGAGAFGRYFYATRNGTCGGDPTDSFDDLPVGECVGPFGAPRPWGAFTFVEGESDGSVVSAGSVEDKIKGGADGGESEDRRW